MQSRFLGLSTVVLLGLVGLNHAQDGKKDLDPFQGTWDVVDIVQIGQSAKKQFAEAKATFTGNKMTLTRPGEEKMHFIVMRLNASAKPKEIDLKAETGSFQGKTALGIYRFEGDTLQLCMQNTPGDPKEKRPTAFASTPDSQLVLMTLRKAK